MEEGDARDESDNNGLEPTECVCVCQRWRGEFRGSSVPPWRAAAATTNQLNRKKIEKMRSEQNPQRRGGKKND